MNVIRYIGWPLLLVHFFVPIFWREQVLALQTIVCAVTSVQSYHAASVAILFVHLSEQNTVEWMHLVLHHVVIVSAVLLEYKMPEYRTARWVVVAWSVRWLGTTDLYLNPGRAVLRCLVFLFVTNCRQQWSTVIDNNYLKTVWVLLVHELLWCILPIQMLYEIYSETHQSRREMAAVAV
jgi:hypothetical protein